MFFCEIHFLQPVLNSNLFYWLNRIHLEIYIQRDEKSLFLLQIDLSDRRSDLFCPFNSLYNTMYFKFVGTQYRIRKKMCATVTGGSVLASGVQPPASVTFSPPSQTDRHRRTQTDADRRRQTQTDADRCR